MELELGLKITKMVGDGISTDFKIAKDGQGVVFVSTETETMFILTAHLKGFKKENVKIDISEDGSRLTITGEKSIQETVMRGWMMYKKEKEKRTFKKVFKIPDGVVLDRINADFNEDESTLIVEMPKVKKGMSGTDGVYEMFKEEETLMSPPSKRFKTDEEAAPGTHHEARDHKNPKLYFQDWVFNKPGAGGGKPKGGTSSSGDHGKRSGELSMNSYMTPFPFNGGGMPIMQPEVDSPAGAKTTTDSQLATVSSHVHEAPKDMQEEKLNKQEEKDTSKKKIMELKETNNDPEESKKEDKEHIQQREEVIGKGDVKSSESHEQDSTEKPTAGNGKEAAQEKDDQQQKKPHDHHDGEVVNKKGSSTIFSPCVVMGSALIASIVVIVVGFMNRSKKKQ